MGYSRTVFQNKLASAKSIHQFDPNWTWQLRIMIGCVKSSKRFGKSKRIMLKYFGKSHLSHMIYTWVKVLKFPILNVLNGKKIVKENVTYLYMRYKFWLFQYLTENVVEWSMLTVVLNCENKYILCTSVFVCVNRSREMFSWQFVTVTMTEVMGKSLMQITPKTQIITYMCILD